MYRLNPSKCPYVKVPSTSPVNIGLSFPLYIIILDKPVRYYLKTIPDEFDLPIGSVIE